MCAISMNEKSLFERKNTKNEKASNEYWRNALWNENKLKDNFNFSKLNIILSLNRVTESIKRYLFIDTVSQMQILFLFFLFHCICVILSEVVNVVWIKYLFYW